MGQAAAKTAETLKALVDSLNGLKDIDVKELGKIIKDATHKKASADFDPQEHIDHPY